MNSDTTSATQGGILDSAYDSVQAEPAKILIADDDARLLDRPC